MTVLTEATTIQDIAKYETDALFCRNTCEVYAGQALAVGDICEDCSSSNDAKKQVVAGVNDVQTLTLQAGADGGTMALRYRGVSTAPLAYNVSTADMQTAIRALHADVSATVVSGSAGVSYVFTTATTACEDIVVGVDLVTDGGVSEPVSIAHSTQGVINGGGADSICLVAATCVDEVQSLVFSGTPTGGTFALTLTNKTGAEVTTTAIAYDATAATISSAIDVALDETAQCVVTGAQLPDQTLTATWSGESYSGRPQEMIVADLALSTGGTPVCVITETTEGDQGESVFLTRGPAVVDTAYLDYNSCTEANVKAALAALDIQVRIGPTYTTA